MPLIGLKSLLFLVCWGVYLIVDVKCVFLDQLRRWWFFPYSFMWWITCVICFSYMTSNLQSWNKPNCSLCWFPGAAITKHHKRKQQAFILPVLEARRLRPRCRQGHALSKALGMDPSSRAILGVPWCVDTPLWLLLHRPVTLSLCPCLPMTFSSLCPCLLSQGPGHVGLEPTLLQDDLMVT